MTLNLPGGATAQGTPDELAAFYRALNQTTTETMLNQLSLPAATVSELQTNYGKCACGCGRAPRPRSKYHLPSCADVVYNAKRHGTSPITSNDVAPATFAPPLREEGEGLNSSALRAASGACCLKEKVERTPTASLVNAEGKRQPCDVTISDDVATLFNDFAEIAYAGAPFTAPKPSRVEIEKASALIQHHGIAEAREIFKLAYPIANEACTKAMDRPIDRFSGAISWGKSWQQAVLKRKLELSIAAEQQRADEARKKAETERQFSLQFLATWGPRFDALSTEEKERRIRAECPSFDQSMAMRREKYRLAAIKTFAKEQHDVN